MGRLDKTRVCGYSGCPNLSSNPYCDTHAPEVKTNRNKWDRTYHGSEWPRISKRYLKLHPYCQCNDTSCGVCKGSHSALLIPATQVDHIIPLKSFTNRKQAHNLNNLQSLCLRCHSSKTIRKDRSKPGMS